MSENHINRFFKRNKLKPRRLLNVNSPELSPNSCIKKLSSTVQGNKSYL